MAPSNDTRICGLDFARANYAADINPTPHPVTSLGTAVSGLVEEGFLGGTLDMFL
jgi:hypothetical protein